MTSLRDEYPYHAIIGGDVNREWVPRLLAPFLEFAAVRLGRIYFWCRDLSGRRHLHWGTR